MCLTGVSSVGRSLTVDAGSINREVVLENDVIVGSVNANARHYRLGADALAAADPAWLRRLLTRTVRSSEPPRRWIRPAATSRWS